MMDLNSQLHFLARPLETRIEVQHFGEASLLIGKSFEVFHNLCFAFQGYCLCS